MSFIQKTAKLFFTVSLFILLSTTAGYAQSGSIQGTITTPDNEPIPNINIMLQGTTYGAASNSVGHYKLTNIPTGQYTLLISGIGYQLEQQSIEIRGGQQLTIDITLDAAKKRLAQIVVTGQTQSTYTSDKVSNSLKLQTALLGVPQNIQVVTGELIRDQQIFNMVEGVTRNVSGVHRSGHWDNLYARIYSRGSKIPAFRNGLNVEMPWGPLATDMSMVERIEFVKGPAGFMMANGEPGGFYNVVTEKPTGSGQTQVATSLSVGSFSNLRTTFDIDGSIISDNKLLYRLNLMGQQKGSFREFDFNDRYAIVPVLQYQIDENTTITAEYTYQYSKFRQPGGYVASPDGYASLPQDFTASDPKIGPIKINDHSLFLTLHHQINDRWDITGKMAYFNYDIIGQYVYPGAIDEQGNMTRPVNVWDAEAQNKLAQIFIRGKAQTGSVKHHILAGLDISNKQYIAIFDIIGHLPDLNIYQPDYTTPSDSIPVYNPQKSLNQRATYRDNLAHTAIYVQDQLHFWNDQLRLTLAGRFTSSTTNDIEEQVFTPRIGLSVSINDHISVYSLFDQAYIPQGGQNFEGESFDPVRGYNLEAGVKSRWFDNRFSSTVTIYQINKENVLTRDPEHPDFSVQLGQIQSRGVEVDIKGNLLDRLDLVINYAFTDSKITEDTDNNLEGEATPGSIKHIQNTWLTYHFKNKLLRHLSLSMGYQWQIGRTSWFTFDGLEKTLPNYFRLDGSISWQNEHLRLALNVNNILDEYLFTGNPPSQQGGSYIWITQPPRNFRLTVGYQF